VKFRSLFTLLEDLIAVLPSRSRPEWQELTTIDAKLPTVILVSGFAATNRKLSVMRKRLARDGFNVVILSMDWQTLSDGVRGLYRMSEKLSGVVLKLRKGALKGDAKIFLVAHSAGGLVARHYVQLLGGSHYCDALVTLATPHQGTWIAVLGLFSHLILKARILLQMLPVSPFIKKINAAGLPQGFRLVSISSIDDFMCPHSATRLPPTLWADEAAEAVELNGLSHSDFLLSNKSYQLMLSYLKQSLPHEPAKESTLPAP
jgi:triacylglycerol lipase